MKVTKSHRDNDRIKTFIEDGYLKIETHYQPMRVGINDIPSPSNISIQASNYTNGDGEMIFELSVCEQLELIEVISKNLRKREYLQLEANGHKIKKKNKSTKKTINLKKKDKK